MRPATPASRVWIMRPATQDGGGQIIGAPAAACKHCLVYATPCCDRIKFVGEVESVVSHAIYCCNTWTVGCRAAREHASGLRDEVL